jgi:hypothetical protein
MVMQVVVVFFLADVAIMNIVRDAYRMRKRNVLFLFVQEVISSRTAATSSAMHHFLFGVR